MPNAAGQIDFRLLPPISVKLSVPNCTKKNDSSYVCGSATLLVVRVRYIVVSTVALLARARGSFPSFSSLKETKMFLHHPLVKLSIVGNLREREVAYSASDRQGSNFESCVVWRAVSSHSSHHPQEVFLAQLSLLVNKSDLKPDSFIFWSTFVMCFTNIYKEL